MFVGLTDFAKRGVLTLVDEILRYRNYPYYYYNYKHNFRFLDCPVSNISQQAWQNTTEKIVNPTGGMSWPTNKKEARRRALRLSESFDRVIASSPPVKVDVKRGLFVSDCLQEVFVTNVTWTNQRRAMMT